MFIYLLTYLFFVCLFIVLRLALYMLGVCMGELGLWESGYRELSEALTARKIAYGDGHINVAWGESFAVEWFTVNKLTSF